MLSAQDELALVRRTLDGDERAFADLVRATEKVLFNLALRIVKDYEDAQDLTQVVFVKAYRNLGSFDQRNKFFSWIYRIMINEAINLTRRRHPQEELNTEMRASGPTPEDDMVRAEVDAKLRGAIMKLSPDYRDAILMRHFLNLSHREISDLLGVPEKTVKSRLHSARRKLGEWLARVGIVS
jgi:RNA polymerase sigma-70 factor (ECF subfamily)